MGTVRQRVLDRARMLVWQPTPTFAVQGQLDANVVAADGAEVSLAVLLCAPAVGARVDKVLNHLAAARPNHLSSAHLVDHKVADCGREGGKKRKISACQRGVGWAFGRAGGRTLAAEAGGGGLQRWTDVRIWRKKGGLRDKQKMPLPNKRAAGMRGPGTDPGPAQAHAAATQQPTGAGAACTRSLPPRPERRWNAQWLRRNASSLSSCATSAG